MKFKQKHCFLYISCVRNATIGFDKFLVFTCFGDIYDLYTNEHMLSNSS